MFASTMYYISGSQIHAGSLLSSLEVIECQKDRKKRFMRILHSKSINVPLVNQFNQNCFVLCTFEMVSLSLYVP